MQGQKPVLDLTTAGNHKQLHGAQVDLTEELDASAGQITSACDWRYAS